MGCRLRERQNSGIDQTVFFDTKYAYIFIDPTGFVEFLPGTTWTGLDSEFFWTTNYWVDKANNKIFWATNYSLSGDPIRYTNATAGTNWIDFTPPIDSGANIMWQALILIPFRGRLVAFNTSEGTVKPGLRYTNRIRWAEIGNPFYASSGVAPNDFITTFVPNAWFDDIRGKGGFLDIPTSEDIMSVGFVRDNLVIYCENSTWQLRYTGRSIAPFQIEKVNSELGTLSTFSAIQFDTSLVGIGDKGIVECDSFKSALIDIKIPDYVYHLQYANSGAARIYGVRDFENRLAFWTIPTASANGIYPDQRLVYNYENDSWATFNDSFTCFGPYQPQSSRTWINTHKPWIECNFNWINQPLSVPAVVAGNQQGFIELIDELTTNDETLFITAITSHTTTPTEVTSPNHNMQTGQVIEIYDIPVGTPFDNLNFAFTTPFNNVFSIIVLTPNTFTLMKYSPLTQQFSIPQLDTATGFVGKGTIALRDNFTIQSKKFNFLEEGQAIQIGYIDLLMSSTGDTPEASPGAISLNVYLDYNTSSVSNILDQNEVETAAAPFFPDTFFNATIPTTQSDLNTRGGSKFWHRVYCPTRSNFITLEYSFSNAQMSAIEQTTEVQIDAQILWVRRSGKMVQTN